MATLLVFKTLASIVSLHVSIFITVYRIIDLISERNKKKVRVQNTK